MNIIGYLLGWAMGFWSCWMLLVQENTDLEIYTDKDIYYIEGLTVTRESDALKLTFDGRDVMKDYMSYQTAKDLKD